MLRRAANNAYSWWWASHVRTKQSKWLEENLQDIEDKVQYALKLLEDEGDSFAKRAEMYYKRRPELISFVEESFKAYRALAERYDHISKELQNANTTIASVFPDQVPEFGNEEDDVDVSSKPHKDVSSSNKNVPKVPQGLPMKNSEAAKMFISRKGVINKEHAASSLVVNKSGMSKEEAVQEIDKLQKEILALQTEKEFVKSSYENGLGKYWEIENCIMEKQGRVCSLQDEFDESVVIEDKEAQILMSTTALRSCKEKLEELGERQVKNVEETEFARKQIKEEFGNVSDDTSLGDVNGGKEQERESLEEKVIKEEANSCLTITDVADKIDELVNDVMNLESLFSSQAALIHRLREEIDDLKAQIKAMKKENDSSQAEEDTIMRRNKVGDMEEKLKGVKDIDQEVEEKSKNIEKHLTQANVKLRFLSKKLKGFKQEEEEEEIDATNVPIHEARSLLDAKVIEEEEGLDEESKNVLDIEENEKDEVNNEEKVETLEKEPSLEKQSLSPKLDIETEDEAFLEKLLANGIEGREKHLLTEYTKVLRSYKEVKQRLDETETRLKSENTMKDEQLFVLNQKLDLLLKGKSVGDDDKEKLSAKEQQQQKDKLFMLIYREDNATKGQNQMMSPKERQFQARVDALLSENLHLLVRFSNSFGQIQQFDNGIKDLDAEIMKIMKQKDQDGGNNTLRSNVRPIYKHLTEIRTEMTIWLEKSLLLKEEINLRASTLGNIQKELTEALKKDSKDSEIRFTIYQRAKFEGEVSNMIKENNRVCEELKTGLYQVRKLQEEVDKTLEKLSEEFSPYESNKSTSNAQPSQGNKTRIPLRSFIFDTKPKKQRLSFLSCIQPSMVRKMKPPSS